MLTYSGLDLYLSRDTRQATNYTANTSFPTTSSVDTHSTGADESREGSNKDHKRTRKSHSNLLPSRAWRTLPQITPDETSTEAGALPPPISYSTQPASTVRYNGGHSQNRPIHEHLPQGSNQASDLTASIPSARLLKSLGNYIQQTHVLSSRRKRVGDGSQDTTLSESDMSAWNRSVGDQNRTRNPHV